MNTSASTSMQDNNLHSALTTQLDTCARCGFCKVVCPTYPYGGGFETFSPRAKVHFLRDFIAGKAEFTPEWVDRLYRCTTCERCQEVCQTSISLVSLWEHLRAVTVKLGLGPMPVHKKLRELINTCGNPYGETQDSRGAWMLEEYHPEEKAELLVFGGCTASYRMPSMLRTSVGILQKIGVPYAYAGGRECCCGSPMLQTGQLEPAAELIGRNLDLFQEKGVKRIVTPCAGCSKTLKCDYPEWAERLGKPYDIEVLHFSELFVELLRNGQIVPTRPIEKTVTFHDPCHVGRSQGVFDQPREILNAIPGLKLIEMPNCRENSRCCGAGGGVKSNYPDMAAGIARDRTREAMGTGADMLVTMCPFCMGSFTQALEELHADMELSSLDNLLMESIEP